MSTSIGTALPSGDGRSSARGVGHRGLFDYRSKPAPLDQLPEGIEAMSSFERVISEAEAELAEWRKLLHGDEGAKGERVLRRGARRV
jgi:hypothetical protein